MMTLLLKPTRLLTRPIISTLPFPEKLILPTARRRAATTNMDNLHPRADSVDTLNLERLSLGKRKARKDSARHRANKLANKLANKHTKAQKLTQSMLLSPVASRFPELGSESDPAVLEAFSGITSPGQPANRVAAPCGQKPKIPYLLRNQPPLLHLPAPIPTAAYLSLAALPIIPLSSPQRLLLVLDLNGTLLHRVHASSSYTPRPFLPQFLSYCLANHSLLIWSSATPSNVTAMCGKLFGREERSALLGEWARDTLDLTPEQYFSRVQVYKRLDRIWNHTNLSAAHPLGDQGYRWCQGNTLLIDDSAMKASAQPHNLLEIPEFIKGREEESKGGWDVLGQVVAYLEEARRWSNVSAFMRKRPYEINSGWGWDWDRQEASMPLMMGSEAERLARNQVEEDEDQDEDQDEEWGGVKLS